MKKKTKKKKTKKKKTTLQFLELPIDSVHNRYVNIRSIVAIDERTANDEPMSVIHLSSGIEVVVHVPADDILTSISNAFDLHIHHDSDDDSVGMEQFRCSSCDDFCDTDDTGGQVPWDKSEKDGSICIVCQDCYVEIMAHGDIVSYRKALGLK